MNATPKTGDVLLNDDKLKSPELSPGVTALKRWVLVSGYSVGHFLVDFACVFLIFHCFTTSSDWHLCLLLYNFCAFAMQAPLGLIADKLSKNWLFALAGCVLVIAAYGICIVFGTNQFVLFAVIILGTGNALYHLGGGIDVLNVSEGRFGPVGLFVSPGAFGIFFGTMLGTVYASSYASRFNEVDSFAYLVVIALAALVLLVVVIRIILGKSYPRNTPFSLAMGAGARIHNQPSGEASADSRQKTLSLVLLFAALCFFLVVLLRSYAGFTLSFEWKSLGSWGLIAVCAVVGGKAIGGFLADRLGVLKVAALSLGAAAVLYLFSGAPLTGVLAIFLFNMTMPITLCAMVRVFPGAKGFSFGLLTFALFLGFLPTFLGAEPTTSSIFAFGIAAVSLLLLLPALKLVMDKTK